jgi:hypothetical protein
MPQLDTIKWSPVAEVFKYNPQTVRDFIAEFGFEPTKADFDLLGVAHDDYVRSEGNALVNAGLQRLSDLITGTGQAFTTTRGMSGVGNSTTATTGVMTALQGASQLYKALDGAPGSAVGVISGSTTYQTGEANFAWEEWCWAISTAAPVTNASFATATTSGVMLNRKVQALGTKASGAVWTLQATITLS